MFFNLQTSPICDMCRRQGHHWEGVSELLSLIYMTCPFNIMHNRKKVFWPSLIKLLFIVSEIGYNSCEKRVGSGIQGKPEDGGWSTWGNWCCCLLCVFNRTMSPLQELFSLLDSPNLLCRQCLRKKLWIWRLLWSQKGRWSFKCVHLGKMWLLRRLWWPFRRK